MERTLGVPGAQATTLVDQNGQPVSSAVRVSLGLDGATLAGPPPQAVLERRDVSCARTTGARRP